MSIRELRASKNNPCRVCGRANQRCLNYGDGGTLCMVHESVDSKQIDCGAVGTGFYYSPPSGNVIQMPRPKTPKSVTLQKENLTKPDIENLAKLSLEDRNKVYRSLLEICGLSNEHRTHLTGPTRQLSGEILNNFGSLSRDYNQRKRIARALSKMVSLEGVPGFYLDDGQWSIAGPSGILIPYQTPQGQIQGFQIRSDNPAKGKYVWFSSNGYPHGTASGTFYHYTHSVPRLDVWVCEGALKAIVASHHTGEAFIGLPGCHISDLQAMVALLPIMPRFTLCPDADYRTNETVRNAWMKNAQLMYCYRFDVRVGIWKPEQGKGIDDVTLQVRTLPRHISANKWLTNQRFSNTVAQG